MYGHTYSKSMDQPGKVASPARDQLNMKNEGIFPCPRLGPRIWSRETGSAVPSRVSRLISILSRLSLVLNYGIPPEFRGGVHLFISIISTIRQAGRPGSSEVPRNPLTRWDVSSISANGILLTKKLKNRNKNAQRVEND